MDLLPPNKQRALFVGVHAGAGHHASSKAHHYKSACANASIQAMKILQSVDGNAVDAVVEAVRVLEDAPCTNAGFGSNLTLDGTVEVDAAIMDGESLNFAAVGAVPDVANPVLVARELVRQQTKGKLSLGRVPPCFLVGVGARDWARSHGIPGCGPSCTNISEHSLKAYKKYKAMMSEARNLPERLDTVGAVALDTNGSVASGVSSGGLILKTPGRVGHAAVYGCGCWAENRTVVHPVSTAVSASGCGEYLIKTNLAKEVARWTDTRTVAGLYDCFQKNFMDSPFLRDVTDKYAGAIVLRHDVKDETVSFQWVHTTQSMCVGYFSSLDSKPHTRISRLPSGKRPGETIVVEGTDAIF